MERSISVNVRMNMKENYFKEERPSVKKLPKFCQITHFFYPVAHYHSIILWGPPQTTFPIESFQWNNRIKIITGLKIYFLAKAHHINRKQDTISGPVMFGVCGDDKIEPRLKRKKMMHAETVTIKMLTPDTVERTKLDGKRDSCRRASSSQRRT